MTISNVKKQRIKDEKKREMSLDEAIKTYTSNAEYERTHGNLQGCLDFRQLAEWLEELKQLREQTRWIPVSKELPKKSGKYIVTVLDGINRRTTVVQYQSRYKTWTMTGRRSYWKVIAWGPLLPEPYKAESEE